MEALSGICEVYHRCISTNNPIINVLVYISVKINWLKMSIPESEGVVSVRLRLCREVSYGKLRHRRAFHRRILPRLAPAVPVFTVPARATGEDLERLLLIFSVFYSSPFSLPTSRRALKDKVTKGILRDMKEEGTFVNHLCLSLGLLSLSHLRSSLCAASLHPFLMVF